MRLHKTFAGLSIYMRLFFYLKQSTSVLTLRRKQRLIGPNGYLAIVLTDKSNRKDTLSWIVQARVASFIISLHVIKSDRKNNHRWRLAKGNHIFCYVGK